MAFHLGRAVVVSELITTLHFDAKASVKAGMTSMSGVNVRMHLGRVSSKQRERFAEELTDTEVDLLGGFVCLPLLGNTWSSVFDVSTRLGGAYREWDREDCVKYQRVSTYNLIVEHIGSRPNEVKGKQAIGDRRMMVRGRTHPAGTFAQAETALLETPDLPRATARETEMEDWENMVVSVWDESV
jgi:hypothetical protein